MRTAIKKTKVYKFDELPEDGKEKAIENLYDINVDYEQQNKNVRIQKSDI